LLWAAVVLLGRWIGFTKGHDFTVPPGVELPEALRQKSAQLPPIRTGVARATQNM
jgi:hypothetical protein